MLAIVAMSSSGEAAEAGAEEFDELADDALPAQHLGDGEDEIGGGRALGQLARQPESRRLRE